VQRELRVTVRTLKFKRREIKDNDSLQELGLADGATVFVNSPAIASAPVIRPPQPGAASFSEDVIARRIAQLREFRFPRDDCERALRAAQFNPDRAVDYLLSGSPIPEPLVISSVKKHVWEPALASAW
jgi:hypothetical protein